jgi:predicted nucleotidyltransferase
LGSNFTLEIGDESLRLLGAMSAIGGYEEIVDQAEEKTVAGFKVKVLPLVLLIVTKQTAGRPKDLAVIPELKATLELQQIKSSPVHSTLTRMDHDPRWLRILPNAATILKWILFPGLSA